MEESLTQGDAQQVAAQVAPTTTASTKPKADGNQETISTEQSQEAVSTATANTETGGGEDDGLAKFAKGQGIPEEEFSSLTDREVHLLKVARDNQSAARNKPVDKKITEQVTEVVDPPIEDETEDASFKREFRQYKYEKQVDDFWKDENKNPSLEPTMAQILKDKQAELTPLIGDAAARQYCFNLSRDLNTLYVQAQIETGTYDPEATKQEGRQEERASIKRKLAAAPEGAHAVQNSTSQTPKVTLEWVRNEYNSKNPDHVKMVNDFFGGNKK